MELEVISSHLTVFLGKQSLGYTNPQQIDHCEFVIVHLDSLEYRRFQQQFGSVTSHDIYHMFTKWVKEMIHAARHGCWIFVSVGADCRIPPDNALYSFSLLECFGVSVVEENLPGKKILWLSAELKKLLGDGHGLVRGFYSQYELKEGWVELASSGKGNSVAAFWSCGSGGIVLLPEMLFPYGDDEQLQSLLRKLKSLILRAYDSISGLEPSPEWVSSLRVATRRELDTDKCSGALEKKIRYLQNQSEELAKQKGELQEIDVLLFGTGRRLERVVHKLLGNLGFHSWEREYPVEIDFCGYDIQGRNLVVEVSAKDSAEIDVKKFNQLRTEYSTAISEIQGLDLRNTSAALVGNGHRLTQADQRSSHFSNHVKDLARKFEVILIEAPSLYPVAIYLIDFPDDDVYKKACREAIFSSRGRVVKFPDPPKAPTD